MAEGRCRVNHPAEKIAGREKSIAMATHSALTLTAC
jgi:hypothetical protein